MTEKNSKIGRLIIVSAASGTGKTSLVKALRELELDLELAVSVSYTTRQKRRKETDSVDYFFIDSDAFKTMVDSDEFLEYATVLDNNYGTSKQWVNEQLKLGKDIILEIDWKGMQNIRSFFPDCYSIFILPPSYKALKSRLLARAQDDRETLQLRLRDATSMFAHCHEYDALVINDKFEQALSEMRHIIEAVRKRQTIKQQDWSQFIDELIKETKKAQQSV